MSTRLPDGELEVASSGNGASLASALEHFEGLHLVLRSKVFLDQEVLAALRSRVSSLAGREITIDLQVDPHQESGAVLLIGDDRRVVLDSRWRWLADLGRAVTDRRDAGDLVGAEDTYAFLRKTIEETEPELRIEELFDTGTVDEVGDGVALVSGLKNVGSQELVEFEGGVFGLAFTLQRQKVGCILLGPEENIRQGGEVRRTGHLLRVPVGEALEGRVVNALGQPLDAAGALASRVLAPVERKAPGIVDRQPVEHPLHTGVKVVDALVPLGRGQRELIIGDRKIGKTTLAIDTILSQRDTGVHCIYAAIGQKASSVARVVETLRQHGAMEYTTVVVALPNEQPAFRHIAPYTACSIGEWYMDHGQDALVVYDDLTKHAFTYREMSALLKHPIGREAYPGDIFYVHSRLLERAARLSEDLGGGSLTALPIVETLAGDISAFIPTNIVSICDGQIFLDTSLFNENFRPAMDVGLSVSRVGGSAQTPAMKGVAGRLRIDLAQYQEMAQFVKFGAEVDQATLQQLARGERGRELLKQPQHSPMPLEHELAVLFAVVNGLIDDVPTADLARFESLLLRHLASTNAERMQQLAEGRKMTAEDNEALTEAVLAFKRKFAEEHEAQAAGEAV